jgi:hypothetical protein
LKVHSIKPVTTWTIEKSTPTVTETHYNDRTEISVHASHPYRYELTANHGDRYVTQSRDKDQLSIKWMGYPNFESSEGFEVTWSMRVIMESACETEAPCGPPADAKLELGKPVLVRPQNSSGSGGNDAAR